MASTTAAVHSCFANRPCFRPRVDEGHDFVTCCNSCFGHTHSAFGLGPIWVGAHMGPYGPLWAHMGPKGTILLKKSLTLMKNDKIANKNIKNVKSERLKIKRWFCDKDLSS